LVLVTLVLVTLVLVIAKTTEVMHWSGLCRSTGVLG
jgi:hypothetical protein